MRKALIRHPTTPCDAVTAIEVDATRDAGRLTLRYVASGTTGALFVPEHKAPARTDNLWQTTCFEAFIKRPGDKAYAELNLSPSTRWAAYRFTAHREGMTDAHEIETPRIETRQTPQRYELDATVALDRVTNLPLNAPWHLSITVVIEETNGRKSYWALAHAPDPEKPDFHHPDGFVLDL